MVNCYRHQLGWVNVFICKTDILFLGEGADLDINFMIGTWPEYIQRLRQPSRRETGAVYLA
ncbi:MAG: hypothetical protein ABEI86_14350, partial [Halobacteriaceae archaeon]